MKTIQATEAKAKFSALLGDVERGETVDITRHGRTIARLVPVDDDYARRKDAVQALREWRKTLPKTNITAEDILSARDHGRK
jgi:prevent-host-death family protein